MYEEAIPMQTNTSICMKVHLLWRILYIVGIVMSVFFAIIFLLTGRWLLGGFFVVVALFSTYTLILAQSYVAVDNERLFVHAPPHGDYQIRWDEVRHVETNNIGFVFRGDTKTLVFNTLMGDANASRLRSSIEEFSARRGTPIQRVAKMLSAKPQNTKRP
jgi:hypothetical protein